MLANQENSLNQYNTNGELVEHVKHMEQEVLRSSRSVVVNDRARSATGRTIKFNRNRDFSKSSWYEI